MSKRTLIGRPLVLLLVANLTWLVQAYAQSSSAQDPVKEAYFLIDAGVAKLKSGENSEAVPILSKACTLAPQLPQAHHNYGVALAKSGRVIEGIAELKEAVRLRPDYAGSLLTLAGICQGTGNMEDAYIYYKEYLDKFPSDSNRDKVASLVQHLDKELNKKTATESKVGILSGVEVDYFDELSSGRKLAHWPNERMPLRVYIYDGEGKEGYERSFPDILKQCFEDWASASGDKVSFSFVDSPEAADLLCTWVDDVRYLSSPSEAGEAKTMRNHLNQIISAKVYILTYINGHPAGEELIREVCLHEIGHALGLAGHTTNPNDIMYFSTAYQKRRIGLSLRDGATLQRLYSQE